MRIMKMDTSLHPINRWRWDAAGMFGYCTTKRGAIRAALRAIARAKP